MVWYIYFLFPNYYACTSILQR
uniref:Uncharacterized protein n=1 Tax=Lepeophtheirus salmonis TaxID=72036 RepID=A0A0K2U4X4_LEPSM